MDEGGWFATRHGSRLHYFQPGQNIPVCGAKTFGPMTVAEREAADTKPWHGPSTWVWEHCRHCEMRV